MKTFIFKIQLLDHKNISREIEVLSNVNLYNLAAAIVFAYDFNFDHCFGFFSRLGDDYYDSESKFELFTDLEDQGIEPTGAGSVKKTKIIEVWKKYGDKMLFLFDYGDSWEFSVELKKIGTKDPKIKYPKILAKTGKAPEQYPEVD